MCVLYSQPVLSELLRRVRVLRLGHCKRIATEAGIWRAMGPRHSRGYFTACSLSDVSGAWYASIALLRALVIHVLGSRAINELLFLDRWRDVAAG